MKSLVAVLGGAAIFLLSAGRIVGDETEGASCPDEAVQSACAAKSEAMVLKCPVSGHPANREAAAKYKNAQVYFCCSDCIPAFKENTEKYRLKANQQLVLSGEYEQIACPLTGAKFNPGVKIKVGDVGVAFCCKNCQAKVAKVDAAEQCKLVFGEGFEKAFALAKVNKEKK